MLIVQNVRLLAWCNSACFTSFLLEKLEKNWKNKYCKSICKKQVRRLIESRYFLVRITLNRLEKIGNRTSVFPFAFLVWCSLIVVDWQSLNNQELIIVILTYEWRKITVLPRISPVVTDMMKPTHVISHSSH